jgi:hypothetical protein
MLLFYLAIFVGDTPIPLPNVKASLLTSVSYSSICICIDKLMVFFRLLNFVIIIKMIKKQKKSMMMRMMIQIKIFMNQKSMNFSFCFSSNEIIIKYFF